jgi:hypothetical protein
MKPAFLKTQLQLLISQFGRRAVLEAFAGAADATAEQIEDEIAKLETARRLRSPKHRKSLDELLESLPPISPRAKELVERLGRMFETKQFLPNLRDAEEFLRRGGLAERKYKTRTEALVSVLKRLSEMPENELQSLTAHSASSSERGDYAVLAKQLMGKKQ